MLSSADKEALAREFAEMPGRVTLLLFTQAFGCDTCVHARRILDEIAGITVKVVIEEANPVLEPERAAQYGVDRAPAIVVLPADDQGATRDLGIRFLGAPSGYEFISLVHAVLLAGGRPSSLSDASLARLAAVDRPVTMRVFTTPTCGYCPGAVKLAHEMAAASPHVTAFAVEATEFPDLARRYRVTGVPKTVVNDTTEILGALPEEAFVEQALTESGSGS